MEKLNVKLAYENCNYAYDQVALNIRKLLQSGDSAYDIVINDIYGLAPLTPEGLFHNINDGKNFDFDNPWWYDDFMSDISIISDMRFILAGDYFIDMLRCSHCLIMNKGMYRDIYGDPEDIYSSVLNKTWTLDSFRTLIDGAAKDLDGNGTMTKDDQFGFAIFEYWGPMIPWLISATPVYRTRRKRMPDNHAEQRAFRYAYRKAERHIQQHRDCRKPDRRKRSTDGKHFL